MDKEMLTVGSLFSGYGGIELGLERTGRFRTVWHCEIDKYASAILTERWPGVPNLGDITKVDWTKVERVDVLCGGFPCFAAGTFVLTYEGHKPIEDVVVGDIVLTHKGRWRRVTSTMNRMAERTLALCGHGLHKLITTDEHPFLARERVRSWKKSTYLPEQWLDARMLTTNHKVCQIMPPENDDEHSADFWRLVGRYLADGWLVDRKWNIKKNGRRYKRKDNGRVVICKGKKGADALETEISKVFHCTRVDERTVVKFHILNVEFYRFLKQFGRGAGNKHIPGKYMSLPKRKATALLEGYIAGDGCEIDGGWHAGTISERLAYSLQNLAHRVLGTVATVSFSKRPLHCYIEDRRVRQHGSFTLSFFRTSKKSFVDGPRIWKCVSRIRRVGRRKVYNISVEEDESYVANNVVVHNCQDVSMAGQRRGLKQDTRTGLWYAFAEAVRVLRPRFVIGENVPGLLIPSGREQAALATVLAQLSSLGYDAEWQTISASELGAPHRRERVFIVGTKLGGVVADADQSGPLNSVCAGRDGVGRGGEVVTDAEGEELHRQGTSVRDEAASAERGCACDERTVADSVCDGPSVEGYESDGLGCSQVEECVASDASELRLEGAGSEQCATGTSGSDEDVAESEGSGLEGRGVRHGFADTVQNLWENFPSQPAVRGGNDGSPFGMDATVFSELVVAVGEKEARKIATWVWKERIKALGNGVVPACAEEAVRRMLLPRLEKC